MKKYYKLSGAVLALGALLFMGFGCGGGDDVSTDEEEYIAGQLAPLKADISSVREEIAPLGEKMALLLKTTLEGLASQEDIAKVQKDIDNLRGEINSLAARVKKLEYKPAAVVEKAPAPAVRPRRAPRAPVTEPTEELGAVSQPLPSAPQVKMRERSARQNLGLIDAIAGGDFASIYFLLQ